MEKKQVHVPGLLSRKFMAGDAPIGVNKKISAFRLVFF
jgi:hypothetical protein